MASVYDLKPKFQGLLKPAMRAMVGIGLSANAVTIIALLGSFAVGALVAVAGDRYVFLLAIPVWLFLRMALNAIDGMIAREYDQATDIGAVLNELGDVVSDTALYLPLAIVFPHAAVAIVLFVLGAALTEFCGVLGQALGAERHYEGPMGKSDRAFIIGALAVAVVVFPVAADYAAWVFGIAAALTLLTCRNRLRGALADLAPADGPDGSAS